MINPIRYEFIWFEAVCAIKCPYCGKELILDSEDEPKVCSCGRIFKMTSHVEEVEKKE